MKKNMSRVEASLSAKLVESEAKREKAEKILEEATKNLEKRLEEATEKAEKREMETNMMLNIILESVTEKKSFFRERV